MASDHSIVDENQKSIKIKIGDKKQLELSKKKWMSLKLTSLRPKNTPLTIVLLDVPGVIIEITKISTLNKKLPDYCKELGLSPSCQKNILVDKKQGIYEDLIIVESPIKYEVGIYYHVSLKYNKKDISKKELKEVLEVINEKRN
jgi:hypothetical protein